MVELAAFFITVGAVGSYNDLSYISMLCISLLFGAGFCVLFPYKKSCVIVVVCIVLCFTGAGLVSLHKSVTPQSLFGMRTFPAKVLTLEKELTSTKIVVRDRIYNKQIQITTYNHVTVLPGDIVEVSGSIEQPEDFVTDTGRVFSYRAYLHSKHIVAVSRNAQIELQQKGGFSISRAMTILRYKIADTINEYVSFPNNGVASGMVFGYQGDIPKAVEELFRSTGVLHTLVLSGYNITLLGGCLGLLLRHIPQRLRIVLTIVAIVSLVLVSGAGVASVRAGVMGSIGLLSVITLRQYNAWRALLISYLLFFIWSPTMVFIDPGFHLSFLATFCMIAVVPKIEHVFYFLPDTPYINMRELGTLALVMPLFIIPYIMYFSGVVPLAALPANIVLGSITPIIMILAPLVIMTAWIAPLASVVGVILSFVLSTTREILKVLDHLPQYNTPELASWSVVGIYSVLFFFLFKKELQLFIERLRSSILQQTNSSELGNQ